MTLYVLKPRLRAGLRPIARRGAALGISANQVTVVSAVVSMALGIGVAVNAVSRALFLLIPLWLVLRLALNALDGLLAAEHGQRSPLGAYLNELSDVLSDAALYAPFAFVAPFSVLSVGVVIFLSTVCEFAGALGPMVGGERRYDGPMGKSDRAIVFGGLGVWIGMTETLPSLAAWLMPALGVLLVATVINRVSAGLRATRVLATHASREHEQTVQE
jgi:CDP-diacylglycerol--glycerol-3-phosphate 3-phosphatidyltransferase